MLIGRLPGDIHLEYLNAKIIQGTPNDAQFVMTGKAGSTQVVKRFLKEAGVGNVNMKAKAYWATGKIGLD